MAYLHCDLEELRTFCEAVFRQYGFSKQDSSDIVDVFLQQISSE